jgi:hypothetical protein
MEWARLLEGKAASGSVRGVEALKPAVFLWPVAVLPLLGLTALLLSRYRVVFVTKSRLGI